MGYGLEYINPALLPELQELFVHQLSYCNVEKGETVLAITDSAFHPYYASACTGAAAQLGAEAVQLVLPQGRRVSEELLKEFMKPADLIVYSTTHTLHYSAAMRESLKRGARALMAVVPIHIMQRRIADPDLIRRTKWGAAKIDKAVKIQIKSSAGTDLLMEKGRRPGVGSYGVADVPGHLDFWGAGFFQTALSEGTMEGKLVLDRGDLVFHFGEYIDYPVTIYFERGKIVSIEGRAMAKMIDALLTGFNEENSIMAGHLAFGTDPQAQWTAEAAKFPVTGGGGADAEAYYGNVQVEIGSNTDVMFQGKNSAKAHLGLCSLNCSVWFDDEAILDQGEYVHDELKVDTFKLPSLYKEDERK